MKIKISGSEVRNKGRDTAPEKAQNTSTKGLLDKTPKNHEALIQPPLKQPKQSDKITFKLLQPEYNLFKIVPNANTKNDKVNLLIDSFSGSYKEAYQQFNKVKFDEDGILLPEQDKVFFETIIGKSSFEQYIVVNKDLSDFIKQQLTFTWYDATINESDKDYFEKVDTNHIMGFDFLFKYTSGLSLKNDGRIQEKPLREFLELARILQDEERVYIQFGFQPCEREWYKMGEKGIKELPKRVKAKEISKTKVSYPGFDCSLRLLVQSKDPVRADQISRGFILAIKQLDGDNELVAQKIHPKKLEKWFNGKVKRRKIDTPFNFNKRMIMTGKEIGNFIKLPQRHLQIDFDLKVIERTETQIPKSLRSKDGVLIGHAERNGKKIPITLPTDNLDSFMSTYVFTGSPRVGKDSIIINIIVESAKKGCGAIIPDVIDEQGNNRGMADSIRDAISPEKIIDINLSDYYNPVYFGLEDLISLLGENGINIMANNLVKILGLDEHAATQRLCRLVAKACKCNIYEMANFIRSDHYAKMIYERILQEDELLALQLEYEYFEDTKNTQAKNALYTRLDEILGNDHFKHMMAQEPVNKLDIEKWIRERKIVILRMKKMNIGDLGIQMLVFLLSLRVFWIKKIIETDDPTFLVFNEPHQYMSDELEQLLGQMLVESPKYRLSMLIAFHYPSSLYIPKELYNAIRSASINWFLFKNTNMSMYQSVIEQLEPITLEAAMKTEQHESIFIPYINGKQETPFFMRMLPPPSMRMDMYDNSYLTKEHTQKYGKPVGEVRERIKNIEIEMYKKIKEERNKKKSKDKDIDTNDENE